MVLSAIRSDIDFLCGSTTASYPTTDKNRNINIAYSEVARIIWESDSDWQYDDSNSSTLPVAFTTLVHNQRDYTLPTVCQSVRQVEIQDSGGTWIKLSAWDEKEDSRAKNEVANDLGEPGIPKYYNLVGRSVELIPAPASGQCTMASGIAVYLDRDVTEITAASAVPGFAKPFHRILSYAAAIDFVQDENQRSHLVKQRANLESGLVRFYSKRAPESKTAIKPSTKKGWRQYL